MMGPMAGRAAHFLVDRRLFRSAALLQLQTNIQIKIYLFQFSHDFLTEKRADFNAKVEMDIILT